MSDALPPHVAWLAHNHLDQYLAALAACQKPPTSVEALLGVFAAADPSPGHHATQWLVECLHSGGLLWEDVQGAQASKAWDTLELFAQHRAHLVGPARQLASYPGLAALYKAVLPWIESGDPLEEPTPAGRELRRVERARARAESTVLYEAEDVKVVVPNTHFAAQWWGRGTRWCTSGKDSSQLFGHYDSAAPLVIAVLPHERYQLWLGGAPNGNVQFMDSADDPVKPEQSGRDWAALGPLVTWACTLTGHMLQYVPPCHRDPDLCAQCVELTPDALTHVPEALCSKDMCRRAVEGGTSLLYVPLEHIDYPMAMSAVRLDGRQLVHVPPELLDQPMCLAAIASGQVDFKTIPPELRNLEVCRAAVALDGNDYSYIPREFRTRSMLELALQTRPSIVRNTPLCGEHLDQELCRNAVAVDGTVLRFVPRKYQDLEMCRLAIKSSAFAGRYLPSEYRTADFYRGAELDDGMFVVFLDRAQRSYEMSLLSVGMRPSNIMQIPDEHKTAELCAEVFATHSHGSHKISDWLNQPLLGYVPLEHRTPQLCTAAIRVNALDVFRVPDNVLSQDMFELALSDADMRIFILGELALGRYAERRISCLTVPGQDMRAARQDIETAQQWPQAIPLTRNWTLDSLDGLCQAYQSSYPGQPGISL